MTDAEVSLTRDVFGEGIDTDAVRIGKDIGLAPPPRRAKVTVDVRRPTRNPCVREPTPPRAEAPPAFATWNSIFMSGSYYAVDGGFVWPEAVRWPHTLILVHELVHVWQWQNREITGYSPLAAAAEGFRGDAYFYESGDAPDFFDYGYEQQATIVEDYVCYLFLAPNDPELADLRELVRPVVDVDRLETRVETVRPGMTR